MDVPQISVTMAVSNVERYLSRAIESVLSQTFTNFEFIIVDFGSSDRSREIVAAFAAKDRRIRGYQIPACTLPEARNAACSHARAPYIAVMDADDVCVPQRFQWEIEFLENNPSVGLVGGATEWIDASGTPLGIHEVPCGDSEIREVFPVRCPFWHPTIMVRREALQLVGGYRNAFVFAHDYDMELRVSDHFDCANLKQVVLHYRIHPAQVSLRKQQTQTMCKIAAQVSASARRSTQPDPLAGVSEITASLLRSLGVSDATQQRTTFSDCRNWIRTMLAAGEYSAALRAAVNMLNSGSAGVEDWQVADLQLTRAQLLWRQGEVFAGVGALTRALAIRPLVLGRAIRGIFGSVGHHSANQ